MRILEKQTVAIADKYSKVTDQDILDYHLLSDVFVLKFLDALTNENVDILAEIANVHPNAIHKIIARHDKENSEVLDQIKVEELAAKVSTDSEKLIKELGKIDDIVVVPKKKGRKKVETFK